MKKALLRFAALITVLCLLLTGCSLPGIYGGTHFKDMIYTRPSLPELNASAERCIELAQSDASLEDLWEQIAVFFALYSDFYTQYLLSYVHYCQDMTDLYWVEEYNYCEEKTPQAQTVRDRLLHELAKCPLREELEAEEYFGENYFDDYDGESIWTDEFQDLKEQEAALLAEYYQILQESDTDSTYTEEYFSGAGQALEELYLQLILLRQQMARSADYDSYPEFAFERLFYRDYTVENAAVLCEQISQALSPLYRQLEASGFWEKGIYASDQWQTFRYLHTIAINVGGQIERALELMSKNDLYDISDSKNKYKSSFEVYFYDYDQPYVFLSPTGTELDHLSFAHEFGHFCNDYVSGGSVAGIDTAEVFSQGMEYLSLIYSDPSQELKLHKLADSLCVYVEQAAYSSFEQQVYTLDPEELTVQRIRDVFEQTCEDFGLDCWELDSLSYTTISHFFTQPFYVISYVVSNDAAFQLYQLEQQDPGVGLQIYLDNLDTEQEDFLPFLEEAGLESPFLEDRIPKVAQTLENALL